MPDILAGSVIDVYAFSLFAGQPRYLTLLRTPSVELGNTWQAIHGRIGRRETAVQAAVRELVAQTGIHPTHCWNVDFVNSFYSPDEDAIYVVPSIAALLPPDCDVRLTPDHVNWEWVAVDEAMRRFIWVGERLAVQTLHEEIAAPMAAGKQPNPYMQIAPSLYARAGRPR